jgi:peroxiredoxin
LEVEVKAIINGFDDSVRANTLKIINAKSEQERTTYLGTVPKPTEAAKQVLAFIDQHLEDPAALTGLNWVIERAANTAEGDAALALLSTKFSATSGIASAVKALQYQPLDKVKTILETVRDKNPNRAEKAAAVFALGGLYFQQYEGSQDSKIIAAARDAALQNYSELTSTYSDVKVDGQPLANTAGQMLFELANLAEGNVAPDIEGTDSEGIAFKLSDYRGRPVAMIFWSDGCHACHDVLPLLEKAGTDMAAKKLVVLGISGETVLGAKASLANNHATMRTWADGATGGSIGRLYNIRRFPTLYLLDASGKILYKGTTLSILQERMNALP